MADRAGSDAQREGEQADQGGAGDRKSGAPLVEWIAAAISAVLVLGVLGYTLHDALRGSEGPPDLAVRSDSIVRVRSGYVVMFTVRNGGSQTAAAATVRGELLRADSVLETRETTIDYVPDQGSRTGGLLFVRDPARDSLALSVGGFQMP